jgi:hypothetical protein
MTRTSAAGAATTVEPAIALADFLQSSFAAQRSGHQRTRRGTALTAALAAARQ